MSERLWTVRKNGVEYHLVRPLVVPRGGRTRLLRNGKQAVSLDVRGRVYDSVPVESSTGWVPGGRHQK